MPYYNQLYKSELLEFNPLYDVDFQRQGNNSNNSKSNGNVNSTSKGNNKQDSTSVDRNLYSDTPQGALNGVESETYLTNARKTTVTDNIENNNELKFEEKSGNESESKGDYFERVMGKTGGKSYSKMLLEFRQTFLNIDKMIIDELSNLFFGLW